MYQFTLQTIFCSSLALQVHEQDRSTGLCHRQGTCRADLASHKAHSAACAPIWSSQFADFSSVGVIMIATSASQLRMKPACMSGPSLKRPAFTAGECNMH